MKHLDAWSKNKALPAAKKFREGAKKFPGKHPLGTAVAIGTPIAVGAAYGTGRWADSTESAIRDNPEYKEPLEEMGYKIIDKEMDTSGDEPPTEDPYMTAAKNYGAPLVGGSLLAYLLYRQLKPKDSDNEQI